MHSYSIMDREAEYKLFTSDHERVSASAANKIRAKARSHSCGIWRRPPPVLPKGNVVAMFDGGTGGGAGGGRDKAAPYVSWPAFGAALSHLRAIGLPDPVRREHLEHLFSHTVVTQAMAALRFLGLTDEEDRPTAVLRDLLLLWGGGDGDFILRGVLERAYPRITALDLSRATREQLDEEFKAFPGSSEAVRRKAMSFFLAAAREAGIRLSAELAEPRRRSPGEDARRRLEAQGVHVNALFDPSHVPEHGAHPLTPNRLLAAIQTPAPPSASNVLPGTPAPSAPEDRADPYRSAFAALSAVWEPDQMPEDVDAAVVTLLRYLRRKEAEATKA